MDWWLCDDNIHALNDWDKLQQYTLAVHCSVVRYQKLFTQNRCRLNGDVCATVCMCVQCTEAFCTIKIYHIYAINVMAKCLQLQLNISKRMQLKKT